MYRDRQKGSKGKRLRRTDAVQGPRKARSISSINSSGHAWVRMSCCGINQMGMNHHLAKFVEWKKTKEDGGRRSII